jgi:hypothetical protein
MGKWASNEVMDAALAVVAGATRMVAVAGQPASYAAAWGGRLAEASVTIGDFAIGAGDASGRKVAVAAKSGAAVVAAGTADHVALVDHVGGRLIYVTTCPAQALPMGGAVNFQGWSVEIGAPV